MSRSRTLALVAIVLAVLLFGACGDDGGGTGDAAPPSDQTSTPANGDDDGDDGDEEPTDEEPAGEEPAGTSVPDACGLVEAAEVEALIGAADPEGETDTALDGLAYSQCTWENETGLFIVAVIGGSERFEMHSQNLPGEPVGGIGEEAITAAGVSSETRGATGGRTISALVDGRTLVVALKVDGQTTVEMVAPIATTVAGRLAG